MAQTIKIVGVEQAVANLAMLPRKVAFKHLRIALNAAGGTIKTAIVAGAPRRTRLLSKSQAVKVKIPDASWDVKHHGKPAYVVIGTKRGAVGAVAGGKSLSIRKATKRVLSGGKVKTVRPSRYAHLAERKHGYMAAAARRAGTQATQRAAQKLAAAFETEAAALPK